MASGRRITSLGAPSQFQRVISDGERFSGRFVLAFVQASDGETLRLGVSSSGKAGRKVARNRLKRLLREAARQEVGALSSGLDLVLIAKAKATGQSLADISADLREVFTRVDSKLAGRRGVGETC